MMVNWTPNSFVGHMFKAVAKHVPPPKKVCRSAMVWGDEATLRGRFEDGISDLQLTRRFYPSWTYPFAVSEVVEFFRQNDGPTQRAFAALGPDKQGGLRQDLEEVFSNHNRPKDGTTTLEAEYLEVIAIRNKRHAGADANSYVFSLTLRVFDSRVTASSAFRRLF